MFLIETSSLQRTKINTIKQIFVCFMHRSRDPLLDLHVSFDHVFLRDVPLCKQHYTSFSGCAKQVFKPHNSLYLTDKNQNKIFMGKCRKTCNSCKTS